MNFFGQALEKTLQKHRIGKTDFAKASGIDRNQLTNIITGRTRSPTKIDHIFTTLRSLLPRRECLALAVAFLEDRRDDISYSSADITVTAATGHRHLPREKLIALYDSDPEIRAALDTIVEAITSDAPPAEQPSVAAEPPPEPYGTPCAHHREKVK